MEGFLHGYEYFIENIAHLVTYTLELIGIVIQFIGRIRTEGHNIKIDLGNWLALGLEFKMGAEIIKTVVARNLEELAILGVVIILRAVLAVLIHWEIKTETKEHELNLFKHKNPLPEEIDD